MFYLNLLSTEWNACVCLYVGTLNIGRIWMRAELWAAWWYDDDSLISKERQECLGWADIDFDMGRAAADIRPNMELNHNVNYILDLDLVKLWSNGGYLLC